MRRGVRASALSPRVSSCGSAFEAVSARPQFWIHTLGCAAPTARTELRAHILGRQCAFRATGAGAADAHAGRGVRASALHRASRATCPHLEPRVRAPSCGYATRTVLRGCNIDASRTELRTCEAALVRCNVGLHSSRQTLGGHVFTLLHMLVIRRFELWIPILHVLFCLSKWHSELYWG